MTPLPEEAAAPIGKAPAALTEAAVLVPIVLRRGELELILTTRTETVRHHKGQVCFPGGVRDRSDETLWQTALREAEEEIGLDPGAALYLCELPTLVTPTGFRVTPFAAGIPSLKAVTPNPAEIADVFHVPLKHFADAKNLRFEKRDYFGTAHDVPFYHYGARVIWGATGRMIVSLMELSREAAFQDKVRRIMLKETV
jgi:8-oxo-dGTP pyrophosphatase MutT (NUDIX family)